jgi:hypothetical protein
MGLIVHNVDIPDSGLGDALRTGFVNQNLMNAELYSTAVFKVAGYDLSKNDFTDVLLAKLNAVNENAEVNVQSDWNELDPTSDAYILNKPIFTSSEILVGADWTGTGLIFEVFADAFPINDGSYGATPATVTLDAADATLDRIDLIVAIAPTFPDTVGTVGFIKGTPASTALVVPPNYDPSTYYVIKPVTIRAAATVPEGAANTQIYNEGTEWTVGLTANVVQNTSDPSVGVNCLEAINWTGVDSMTFTAPAPLSTADLDLLTFDIKFKQLLIKKWFMITIINGTHRLASRIFRSGTNNFDSQNLSYQTIRLDKQFLNLNIQTFDAIEIKFQAITTGFYFDNFKLLKGSGSNITQPFIEDVPNDDILYGRKNKSWEEIAAGGDMFKAIYDPNLVEDDAFSMDNMSEASSPIAVPDAADTLSIWDSVASVFSKITWTNLVTALNIPTLLSELTDDIGATDPIFPDTAFVNLSTGDDATAVFENAAKPYATLDAALAVFPNNSAKVLNIVLQSSGTYPVNNKIPLNFIEISSGAKVTIDFSAHAGNGVVGAQNSFMWLYSNGAYLNRSTLYFNLPNGTIKNDRAGGVSTGSFFQAQTFFKLNILKFDWNSTSPVFYSEANGVIVEEIGTWESKGSFGINSSSYCNDFPVKTLIMPAGGVTDLMRGVTGNINVNTLTIGTTTNQFQSGQTWNIGSTVNGTGDFRFQYHAGTTNFNFNNTTFSIDFRFEQTIGAINLAGVINSVTFASRFQTGTLSLNNLIIKNQNQPIACWDAGVVNVTNCVITCNSFPFEKDNVNASRMTINILGSIIKQTTPTYLCKQNSGYIDVFIGGLETNATSIGNNSSVVVDFTLQSFKDKSKEIVVRSKIDLVNKTLDPDLTYMIDGDIVLSAGDYIEVPAGGNLTLNGYGLEASIITKGVAGESIFSSPVGGSGGLQLDSLKFVMSNATASCFDLVDVDGTNAVECLKINFEGSGNIGTLNGYRQGLWSNIGIFGLSDGITFEGTWSGGFVTSDVIVRALSGITGVLFKKGVALTFASRFTTDGNIDVPAGWAVADFEDANFTNDNTFQIQRAIISRAGVFDDTDVNYFPNIDEEDDASKWSENTGVPNSSLLFEKLKSPNGTVFKIEIDNAGGLGITVV